MADNLFEREKKSFLHTYNRIPLEISRGEGVHLIDKNGNRYLDFFSGLGVNALGYAHPEIILAVTQQITRYSHLSNSFITNEQIELAEMLNEASGMSGVFFSNSGTEAIEGTIKLIRKFYGPDKKIFSLSDSFHGRTYGAMTLTNRAKYQKGFEPLLPNISKIIFNDIEGLQKNVNENTAALFLEFIQGEGGINPVSEEFVDRLKQLREKYGFAIVADEIQSGIGRTGKEFAYKHFEIEPDIVVVAKAIGGGLPLGGFLVNEKFSNTFQIGNHGTTFGGNPVCCAAGIVVLKELFKNGLMNEVAKLGEYFLNELKQLWELFPDKIKDVRGKGFMIGIELTFPGSSFVDKLRERKVLINSTNETVLRLLPPLISKKEHIDFFLYNFHEVLKEG